MRLLLVTFAVLLGITIRSLIDKEPPSLVKPIEKESAGSDQSYERVILAMGDSLTAGYQLLPEESFPAQLQTLLTNAGYKIRVINAGKSGDTSAQMRERLDWSLADVHTGDIFLLTVGGNDGLQGLPPEQLEDNLRAMVVRAQDRGLTVMLGGMKFPPNYGVVYTESLERIYERVAQQTNALLIPFILEGVATISELNLPDGIHPNAAGYAIVAQTIKDFLEENALITKEK